MDIRIHFKIAQQDYGNSFIFSGKDLIDVAKNKDLVLRCLSEWLFDYLNCPTYAEGF